MSGAEREMTLAEWVGRLPDSHAASKEYDALLRERDEAEALLRHVENTCGCAGVDIDAIVAFLAKLEAKP